MLYVLSSKKRDNPIEISPGDVMVMCADGREQWRYFVLQHAEAMGYTYQDQVWRKCLLLTPDSSVILSACFNIYSWKPA